MAEPFLNVSKSVTGRAWTDRLDDQMTRTVDNTGFHLN